MTLSPKQSLRKAILVAMAKAPPPAAEAVAEALAGALEALGDPSGALLGYLPLSGEVDPTIAMTHWHAGGGQMAVPVANWSTHEITPARVEHLEDSAFQVARYGLREPREVVPVPLDQLAAVLVPGVAFDRRGGRLGRGKGFYDRLLAVLPEATPRIAVCTPAQLVEEIPCDEHDQRVHRVIVVGS